MTNEEAIKVLEADKAYLYPDECHNTGAYDKAIEALKNERPQGNCKNCKAYRQYGSRADGYCDISRMTAEGMLHINVNEDFYCSYFEEADNDKRRSYG